MAATGSTRSLPECRRAHQVATFSGDYGEPSGDAMVGTLLDHMRSGQFRRKGQPPSKPPSEAETAVKAAGTPSLLSQPNPQRTSFISGVIREALFRHAFRQVVIACCKLEPSSSMSCFQSGSTISRSEMTGSASILRCASSKNGSGKVSAKTLALMVS
jgi:hypothetical protein